MASLPTPSDAALAHSAQLQSHMAQQIQQQGWLNFAQFMHLALYTPQLGYYSGGAKKFGMGGDFVTAPEISPLFGQCLATQIAQVLAQSGGDVLELGAGTGKLAVTILQELAALHALPAHYYILEVSDYLREIQRKTCAKVLPSELFDKIIWLKHLPPEGFTGCIIANEVLDALPVHLVGNHQGKLFERGVVWENNTFAWQDHPIAQPNLLAQVEKLDLADDYLTEICPQAQALVATLAEHLKQGAMLFIDYGFGQREYYHPQRTQGTLMCHYQHHAHSDPLQYVGLQDITAHVNFTAIAEAGVSSGLQLAGYTSQAQFLINCGITERLQRTSPHDMTAYAPMVAGVQKLLSPTEMGELFKVIGFSKGIASSLLGFAQGDKMHTL